MPTSRKKVIIRTWGADFVPGYLMLPEMIHDGSVGLLDLQGKVSPVPLSQIKWVCFVRELAAGDHSDPERLLRKQFSHRPRTQGLWIRVKLKDGDVLEGITQNDSSLLDADGIFLVPPDIRSNTQRVFLPRLAVVEFEVRAAIRASRSDKPLKAVQESLFKQQN
jgi:hypothetical protein